MPRFPLPEGETEVSWFRKEVWPGWTAASPAATTRRAQTRAEYEMGIIEQMGFCGYFLVVADFIMWAKRNGIRVGPGRGSAAGSIVSYAMGITDLDPIRFDLMFERFLNPERVSMPDIDIDFDERRRGDVIRYVTEKYGDDRVAQIITYGTIKAKAAVKDSARVLGFPYALGDRITKAFPPMVLGRDIPLSCVFEPDHPRYGEAGEIRALYEAEAEVKQVLETARGLEGLIRQAGVHAAGVIMSSEPLLDHIPVWKRPADGAIITQFDYPSCEDLGLLKMDFLGLRNLTILDDALAGHHGQQGRHDRPRDARPGRQGHLRPAGQGRHARGIPARRRADAGAAALDAARPVRRHLGRERAVPARPDGRERAQRLRRPQDGPQARRADSPRARRAAGRHPRRHLRRDRLPGAGAPHRAEAGRVLRRQGGPAAQGDGEEEEGDPGQGVRAVLRAG